MSRVDESSRDVGGPPFLSPSASIASLRLRLQQLVRLVPNSR